MLSLQSNMIAISAAGLLAIGLPVYGVYSTRSSLEQRITAMEHEMQAVRTQDAAKIQELSSDLHYIAEKMDITTHDLEQARKLAETLKQENNQSTRRLRSEIASHSKT